MSTHPWFPIPVYTGKAVGKQYEDIQKELSDVYDKLEFRQNPDWTNDTHDLSVGESGKIFEDCILTQYKCEKMMKFIDKSIRLYLDEIQCVEPRNYIILESWLTRTAKSKYAHLHDHVGDISGVYYFKTNGKDGNIFFPSPLRMLSSNYIIRQVCAFQSSIQLEQGVIGLWPSMLMHNTEPNPTDNHRISVSFNIKFVV